MAALLPQQIHTGIGGQTIQPCGKGGIPPEEGQTLPCGEKRLLRGLLRQFRRGTHPYRQGIDPFLVLYDQLPEGGLIAVSGGLDPVLLLIVHDPS